MNAPLKSVLYVLPDKAIIKSVKIMRFSVLNILSTNFIIISLNYNKLMSYAYKINMIAVILKIYQFLHFPIGEFNLYFN